MKSEKAWYTISTQSMLILFFFLMGSEWNTKVKNMVPALRACEVEDINRQMSTAKIPNCLQKNTMKKKQSLKEKIKERDG